MKRLLTIVSYCSGPGLALNGPVGSMAKAADGMRKEINHIFSSFIIMIFGFASSVFFSFWVVMNRKASYASSALFILSGFVWWRYCSRIYNRFKYQSVEFNAQFDDETRGGDDEPGASALDREYQDDSEVMNPISTPNSAKTPAFRANSSTTAHHTSLQSPLTTNEIRHRSVAGSGSVAGSIYTRSNASASASSSNAGVGISPSPVDGIAIKGFLTKRDAVASKSMVSQTKHRYVWNRRYFVVTTRGRIFTFFNSQHFEESNGAAPSSTAKPLGRPIELGWYEATALRYFAEDGEQMIFEIRLEYADKDDQGVPIVFRCDTSNELSEWMDVFLAFAANADPSENEEGIDSSSAVASQYAV
jgi:hypothetical protein